MGAGSRAPIIVDTHSDTELAHALKAEQLPDADLSPSSTSRSPFMLAQRVGVIGAAG
jgi:hypothetical protein